MVHGFRIGRFAGTSLLVIAMVGSIQGAAMAQSSSGATGADTPAPENAGEIIVTAQRRAERLIDVPVSVQAQSGASLVKAGVVDTRSLEQVSPAVSFQWGYRPDATSLYMRGAGSLSNEGGVQPSVGVVIDNVPVARQAEFLADLADIDRIEVLSGPQGTLFGKNATAGVINIVTNRPHDRLEASFDLTGTNDEEIIGKAMINTPLSDNVLLRVNGYYHYQDPMIKNPVGPDVLGQRSWGAQAKLLFNLSDKTNLLFTGSYNRIRSSFGPQFVVDPITGPTGDLQRQLFGQIGYGVAALRQNGNNYAITNNTAFTAELNSAFSDTLSLVSVTAYRDFKSLNDNDTDAGPFGGVVGVGYAPNPLNYPIGNIAFGDDHEVSKYKYISQELRLNYANGGFNVVAGVYGQRYREKRSLILPFVFDGAFATGIPSLAGVQFFNTTNTQPRLSDDTAAVFGDVTYEVTPTVKIFAGLRYNYETLALEYHRQTYFTPIANFDIMTGAINAAPIATLDFSKSDTRRHDSNLSGRVGAQWQPTRATNVYGSYSRGYKGPGADQGTGVVSAEVALIDPEIADAFELGWKQRLFDNRLAIDAAIYWQQIDNIQQSAVLPGSVTTALVNAGKLRTKGFEVNLTARPIDAFTFNLGVVHNDARYHGAVFFPCGPSDVAGQGKCGANGLQSLNGAPSVGSPRWKVVTSVAHQIDLPGDLKVDTRVGYNWRSKINYQLYMDPITSQSSYGLLDASIGIGSRNDRWMVTLFGKNLTNKFYYADRNTADFFIGRSFARIPRDYKRFGGLRFTYKM